MNIYEVIAIVFITGFAIQQALQIIDPVVMAGIARYKKRRISRQQSELPGSIPEADFKKAVMASLSFLLGVITVITTGITLLSYVRTEWGEGLSDTIITALVLGSGTEAVNTILKFIGYVKEAQKPAPEVEVSIIPSTASVSRGATFQFRVDVKNSKNNLVEWKVLHGNGGKINSDGLYTAPDLAGTFQVIVVSNADSTKAAFATVTVT